MIFWFERRLEIFYGPGIWAFERSQPFLWLLTICNRWKKPQVLFLRKTHSRRRKKGRYLTYEKCIALILPTPQKVPLCAGFLLHAAQGFYHMFLFRKKNMGVQFATGCRVFLKWSAFLENCKLHLFSFIFFPIAQEIHYIFPRSWAVSLPGSFWSWAIHFGYVEMKMDVDGFWTLLQQKPTVSPIIRISYKRVGLRFPI